MQLCGSEIDTAGNRNLRDLYGMRLNLMEQRFSVLGDHCIEKANVSVLWWDCMAVL